MILQSLIKYIEIIKIVKNKNSSEFTKKIKA